MKNKMILLGSSFVMLLGFGASFFAAHKIFNRNGTGGALLVANDYVSRWSPLHRAIYAKNSSLLASLLKKGADVHEADAHGRTPLHYAVSLGFVAGVDVLCTHGACANQQDCKGYTPLHCAAGKGRGAWVEQTQYAAIMDRLLKQSCIEIVDLKGRTPLHYAAMHGQDLLVAHLLTHGARADSLDTFGRAPLHYAAGAVVGYHAVPHDYDKVVGLLLKADVSADSKDKDGKTPLHYAAASGALCVVDALIKQGASLSHCDIDDATPLHYAAGKDTLRFKPRRYWPHVRYRAQMRAYGRQYERSLRHHTAIVAYLCSLGASGQVVDKYGKTPLDYARSSSHDRLFCSLENSNRKYRQ